jgi:hypothetical protein
MKHSYFILDNGDESFDDANTLSSATTKAKTCIENTDIRSVGIYQLCRMVEIYPRVTNVRVRDIKTKKKVKKHG